MRRSELHVVSAWTPAHSEAWTLTYGVDLSEQVLRSLARDVGATCPTREPDFWVDSSDYSAMRGLQARIEAGERFVVARKPEIIGHERQRVPIARMDAQASST